MHLVDLEHLKDALWHGLRHRESPMNYYADYSMVATALVVEIEHEPTGRSFTLTAVSPGLWNLGSWMRGVARVSGAPALPWQGPKGLQPWAGLREDLIAEALAAFRIAPYLTDGRRSLTMQSLLEGARLGAGPRGAYVVMQGDKPVGPVEGRSALALRMRIARMALNAFELDDALTISLPVEWSARARITLAPAEDAALATLEVA
jgi:hypothetical protein